MTNFYTENLAEFGYREISILKDILNVWADVGLPDGFENSSIRPAFNKNSGYVFLTNEDYQVAMLNDGKLELFHNLPYSGEEGFLSDLVEQFLPADLNSDDIEYILQAARISGTELNGSWLAYPMD